MRTSGGTAPDRPVPPVLIPAPASLIYTGGAGYELTPRTAIRPAPAAETVAELLAAALRPATGLPLPVTPGGTGIHLAEAPGLGPEAYQLDVTGAEVVIRAAGPAGWFYGAQTLRQLLPPEVENPARQPGPWAVPPVRIADRPRYAYRGVMLDVARHFFDVATVQRFVDRITRYKINHLHLHLTDDQGWRLAIENWPELARRGGASAVGGGPGGYYTQDDYHRIVTYARDRQLTVVPEIDLPGHTNAALSAYPELNRDGVAPAPYTGMKVGFSSLAADLDLTYAFVSDVLRELAALTPGPYLHLGGDEAFSTTAADYHTFLSRVQPMVAAYGKTVLGWQEIGAVPFDGPRVLQQWRPEPPGDWFFAAVAAGARVVCSPANRVYLDMKYDAGSRIGLDWAGHVGVRDAYDWDPGSYLPGLPEPAVLGVEAPLWSETVTTLADLDYLTFPRLPAVAEVGWSPATSRDWADFQRRLAAHVPRWRAAGIDFWPG